jgi:hypothetical protein
MASLIEYLSRIEYRRRYRWVDLCLHNKALEVFLWLCSFKIFKWRHPFLHFVIISPLKETWPFIWTNLNSLHPRIIIIKFDWIWHSGSIEEEFQRFTVYFLHFYYHILLEKGVPFHLNKTWIPPPPQELFMLSLVKIGLVVLKKKSKM